MMKTLNSAIKLSLLSMLISIVFSQCTMKPNAAKIILPGIFSDNMVLQQEQENNIWGKATPGSSIRLQIDGKTKCIEVGADSSWKATLPPLRVGGPYSLYLIGNDTIKIEDVMAGEVWLASGQSNMAYTMGLLADVYGQAIKTCSNNQIRFINVDKKSSASVCDDVGTGGWQETDSVSVLDFSAAAYFFAKELFEKHNVPVGIISSSNGGTAIEQWMTEESIKEFPKYYEIFEKNTSIAETKEMIEEKQKKWSLNILNDFDYQKINENKWKVIQAPEYFETNAYPQQDGLFWLVRSFYLPDNWDGEDIEMHLGTIDDVDATFINGQFVGNGTWWDQLREYQVNGKHLRKGENQVAIAVADFASNGGFGGPKNAMKIYLDNDSIPLTGEWKCAFVSGPGSFPGFPFSSVASLPSGLYKGMVEPVIDYGMKGVIWYQGEANTNNESRAREYAELFPSLINGWRKEKGVADWPFIFVQLPGYKPKQDKPSESNWALLRESQLKTLAVGNTAMAVTIDIGEANDVHPKNKHDVGRRLFLAAEKVAYGKNIVHSGPVFDSAGINGDTIIINFTETGSGLVTSDGQDLKGFAIAAEDGNFFWADARISKQNDVLVYSSKVKKPVYVRYAWADNPDCNLYNKEGLPASPFRTDIIY